MDLQNSNNNSTEGLSEADASLMNEALIPTQLTFEPESSVYDLAATENDYINENLYAQEDDIDENFILELFQEDTRFVNNTVHNAANNKTTLSFNKVMHQLSKVPEYKLLLFLNTECLTEEEKQFMHNNNISNT